MTWVFGISIPCALDVSSSGGGIFECGWFAPCRGAPKTKNACDACRNVTDSVYDTVQHAVAAHAGGGASGGGGAPCIGDQVVARGNRGRACCRSCSMNNDSSSRSSPNCARLHRLPDIAKQRKRGGRWPQSKHLSARGKFCIPTCQPSLEATLARLAQIDAWLVEEWCRAPICLSSPSAEQTAANSRDSTPDCHHGHA